MKKHIRSLVLPFAIVMGFLFHPFCGSLYCIVPILVFTMLFLNYTAVDVRKMHLSMMDFYIALFQAVAGIGIYLLGQILGWNLGLSEGLMIAILTPVAASVVVISCALGADRERITTATIINNLWIALLAPILFSFIGRQQDMPFLISFWHIFRRIAPQIVLPFIVALLLQHLFPKTNAAISSIKWTSLYVWAFTLTIVLGKTFHDIITSPDPEWHLIGISAIACVLLCIIQFGLGKLIGRHYGDTISGGQTLGQKNTSFGIWMSVEYMTTAIAAITPAIYSICQNLFNSYQMYIHDKHHGKET